MERAYLYRKVAENGELVPKKAEKGIHAQVSDLTWGKEGFHMVQWHMQGDARNQDSSSS